MLAWGSEEELSLASSQREISDLPLKLWIRNLCRLLCIAIADLVEAPGELA